ncbi:MAG: pantoate--beta-alanine ligase, partial [Bacillota bacterium]
IRTTAEIQKSIREKIDSDNLVRIDYAEIVDLTTLRPISQIEAPVLVAAAIYVGKTRLIDNFIYDKGTDFS